MYEHRALPIYTHKKKSVNLVPCMNIPRSYTNKEAGGDAGMTKPWDDGKGGVLAPIWTNTRLRAAREGARCSTSCIGRLDRLEGPVRPVAEVKR